MWESPQITTEQLATEVYGGMAPSKEDVVKSANARGGKRHEVKRSHLADVDVLPDSAELLGNEMVGMRNNGYLAKKNVEYGVNALFNSLPPGMDIEDQENCDIREMQLVVFERGLGYPGDGWAGKRTRGSQMPRVNDNGRPDLTNFLGSSTTNPKNPRGN
jgi:hypothetical protein